jgi:hypothetical protein
LQGLLIDTLFPTEQRGYRENAAGESKDKVFKARFRPTVRYCRYRFFAAMFDAD